jgi:hypothetical protein
VHAERPHEERLATPDRSRERLPVAVPELLAAAETPRRAADEPRQPDPDRKVEPHDDVGGAQHEIAELALVGAVDHPAVGGDDRLDRRAQLVVRRLDPAGAVDERVQLDERHVEPAGQLPAHGGLAVAAGARDHSDLAHGRDLPCAVRARDVPSRR